MDTPERLAQLDLEAALLGIAGRLEKRLQATSHAIQPREALHILIEELRAEAAQRTKRPRCKVVWVPGIVRPPNCRLPDVRTRCFRKPHTDDKHGFTQIDADRLDDAQTAEGKTNS